MIAFVLSGAGNRGPLEVGALRALLEAGIVPDLLVGTSAGAINASYLAAWGATVDTTHKMEEMWAGVGPSDIYPQGLLEILWRLKSNADSVFTSDGMRKVLEHAMPPGVTTFGQTKVKLLTTSTDLRNCRLYLFGDDPKAPLVDAVLASASIPGIHPPVKYQDLQLVDGGVVANVPVSVAMDRGATVIYALNVGYGGGTVEPAVGVMEVIMHALTTMLSQSVLQDIARAKADARVDLHHIQLTGFESVSFRDFSQTHAMAAAGYAKAKAYLAAPAPFAPAPLAAAAPAPQGVVEYVPPFLR